MTQQILDTVDHSIDEFGMLRVDRAKEHEIVYLSRIWVIILAGSSEFGSILDSSQMMHVHQSREVLAESMPSKVYLALLSSSAETKR